jgi:hypothetical protein
MSVRVMSIAAGDRVRLTTRGVVTSFSIVANVLAMLRVGAATARGLLAAP